MPGAHSPEDGSLSPLLSRERPQEDPPPSYSTLRDIGAADVSVSVESLPRRRPDAVEHHIGPWRTLVIVTSLALLVLIQGESLC
jgi:hypothetical protein